MFRKALRPILKPIIGLSRRNLGQDIIRRMRLRSSVKWISRPQVKTAPRDAHHPLVWQMDPPAEESDESYRDLIGLIRERPQPFKPRPMRKDLLKVESESHKPAIKRSRAVDQATPKLLRSEINEDFPVKRADEPPPDSLDPSEQVRDSVRARSSEPKRTPIPHASPPSEKRVSNKERGRSKARKVVARSEIGPSVRPVGKRDQGEPEPKVIKQDRAVVKPQLVARTPHSPDRETPAGVKRESAIQREEPRKRMRKEGRRTVLQHRPAKKPDPLDLRSRRVGRKPTTIKEQPTAPVKPSREAPIGKPATVMRKLVRKWEGDPESSSPKLHQQKAEKPHAEGEIGDLNLTLEVPYPQRKKPVRGRRPSSIIERSVIQPDVRQVVQRTPASPPKLDPLDPDGLWTQPMMRELALAKPPSSHGPVDRRELRAGETQILADPSVKTTLSLQSRMVQRSPAGERDDPSMVSRAGKAATSQSATETSEVKQEVDVDAVAREVYAILKRKLKVEQERIRGWGGFR